MKPKSLPPKTNTADNITTRLIQRPGAARFFLRVGAVLVLAGLLASGVYWSSAASTSSKAVINKKSAVVPAATTTSSTADLVGSRPFGLVSMLTPLPQAAPTVATYASDCTTPKTLFNLQDADKTVCAKVTGAQPFWRILWSNANFDTVQNVPVGSGESTFTLTAASSLGDWRVILYDPFGGTVQGVTKFTVIDAENPSADLLISKGLISNSLSSGGQAVFAVQVQSRGPSDATMVSLSDDVPANTTFVSFDQLDGPVFTCTSPTVGSSSGSTVCTIASLSRGDEATFLATYQVGGVSNGTVISNTATLTSATADPHIGSNTSTAEGTVVGSPCQVSSPENITVDADAGQAGALVTYATPSYSGDCGQPTTGENGETIPVISCNPASGSFFGVGSTTVLCAAQVGDVVTFQVTVNNPGALSISLNGANPLTVECGASFTDPGATAVNGTGQSVEVTVTGPAIDRDTDPGTYTLTYTATEDPNSVSVERTVIVADTEAPSITIDGANPYKIQQGSCSPFVDPGVSANDGCSGAKPVTSSISGPGGATSVNPAVAGTYTVTYTATDGTHDATATRTVLVGNFPEDEVDQPASSNQPPTITLNGDDQITIECGTPFTDPGATATVCGASIPVTATGTVDNHTPGTYSITYSATANGQTTEATRIVTVEADNTAPTITLNGANPTTVECHTSFTDPGAIAHDACAGDFAATASGSVDANTVGSYTITYNATDPSGHAATPVTRTVNVVDTTAPVVTPPANVTVNTGAGAGSCSTTVSDATLGSGSASDSCQGALSVTRTGVPAGNVFPVGTTTVTYSATDAHNNTGTATQTVTVVDNTPPLITCSANIIADFDPAVNGAVVTYVTPVGTDNCSATTTQIAGLPSGATFPVGTTTNTFKVTDGAGNTAQCSFNVTVAITSIIGLDSASLSGNALVDSYNSTGGYPATKGSLANLLSNGTISDIGSSKMFGNVRSTRVGVSVTGTSQVNGNATAGTTVTKGASAVITGTITNNALAPVMTLPSVVACGPPYSPNSGISGTYSYNSSTGNLSLSGNNIATLANGSYCFNNVTLTNSAQLKINGPVTLKLTGTFSAGGASTVNNTTQIPANLRILSSFSGSNGVVFSNGNSAYLLIYAPRTNVTNSGSAPLFGTMVGKTVTISNSGQLHYDTTLTTIWPELWALILAP